jgi:hypothetical protein
MKGFRVQSPLGHLGFVEEVRESPDSGEPEALYVRAGRIVVLIVPAEDIDAVIESEQLVLVSDDATCHVPDFLVPAA